MAIGSRSGPSALPDEVWVAGFNGPTRDDGLGTCTCRRPHLMRASLTAESDVISEHVARLIRRWSTRSPSLLNLMKSGCSRRRYRTLQTSPAIGSLRRKPPIRVLVAHSRQPVRSAGRWRGVWGTKPVLLEVGPGRNLASAVLRHSGRPPDQRVYTTLPHPHDLDPSDKVLLDYRQALGRWRPGGLGRVLRG